jgi:hypothetical protein
MDFISELLKYTIPSAVVLFGVYALFKTGFENLISLQRQQKSIELSKEVLPLRLQAYERIILYMERITPNNLIVRLGDKSFNVAQFQTLLVHEIREEFNHNLSQQIYMSNEAWEMTRKSKEEIIALINEAGKPLNDEAPSFELSKKLFQIVLDNEKDIVSETLRFIKHEARQLF